MDLDQSDREQMEKYLRLYGVAYRMKVGTERESIWLDPTRITVYHKGGAATEATAPQPAMKPRRPFWKRFLFFMTDPFRLALGIPVALIFTWLSAPHHQAGRMTDNALLTAYGSWLLGMLTVFAIREIHSWAAHKA